MRKVTINMCGWRFFGLFSDGEDACDGYLYDPETDDLDSHLAYVKFSFSFGDDDIPVLFIEDERVDLKRVDEQTFTGEWETLPVRVVVQEF